MPMAAVRTIATKLYHACMYAQAGVTSEINRYVL